MKLTEILLLMTETLAPALMAALTWAAAKLAALTRARIDNEYLKGVLLRLDDAVLVAVKELQQTVVSELKAASADGSLDELEQVRVKEAALANVKSYLGPKGLAVLAKILGLSDGSLEKLLSARIEAAVHDIRLAERSLPTAPYAEPALPFASSPG